MRSRRRLKQRLAMCCRAFPMSKPLDDIRLSPSTVRDGELIVGIVRSIGKRRINPESGYDYGRTLSLYRCTKLTRDGRCSIYDSRPDMCRHYECSVEHAGCSSLGHGCDGRRDVALSGVAGVGAKVEHQGRG